MDNDALKRKQKKRIYQHELALWKALNLSYQEEKEPDYNRKTRIEKEIQQKFMDIAADLESASLSSLPSAKILRGYQHILDAYISKEKQKECLSILDKHNQFPYSDGPYRRTVRSAEHWGLSRYRLEQIFTSYYNLSFYADSMAAYYKNAAERIQLEELVGSYSCPSLSFEDDLIAAELDAGTTDLDQVIEDILLSENNTNRITTDIIRGIVKSNHTHLHKILGDFLLAARLQEGVRQAICENMDCGTIDAFLTLFQIITDHDLIRFSAVKRAVSTWTGLCDVEHLDRISNKQLDLMKQSLYQKEYCQTLTKSNDSIELYLGLWTLGFFEIKDAVACCRELILHGTKNQKLVVSYYNIALQEKKFIMQTASQMLETYANDIEICAAFLPTYMSDAGTVLYCALHGSSQSSYYSNQHVYEAIPCHTFYLEEAQARKHFYLWNELYQTLPKKGRIYSPCIFPWYSVSITPSKVVYHMALIAYMLQEEELIDQVCPLFSEIESYDRSVFLRLLFHHPKTDLQKQTLIQALADKTSDTRSKAFRLISELTLEKKDYEQLTALLKYKSADIREHVLDLLEQQEEPSLSSSIETLLTDKKEEMRLGGLDLLMRLKKDVNRKEVYQSCCALLSKLEHPTEKEAIILTELTGSSQADRILKEKGYGLYNPDADLVLPDCKSNLSLIRTLFHRKAQEFYSILNQLNALFTQNRFLEYKNFRGEEVLLDNDFDRTAFDAKKDILDCYPFPALWQNFYQEEIKDFPTLLNLYIFTHMNIQSAYYRAKMDLFSSLAIRVYGKDYLDPALNRFPPARLKSLCRIIEVLYLSYSAKEENRVFLTQAAYSLLSLFVSLPIEQTTFLSESNSSTGKETTIHYALNSKWFSLYLTFAKNWKTEEEFDQMFLHFEMANRFYKKNLLQLSFLDYVKAYKRNLISLDYVYHAAFDSRHFVGLFQTFGQLRPIVCYPESPLPDNLLHYFPSEEAWEENPLSQTALDLYWNMVEMILKVELKRSETETVFSYMIEQISKIRGTSYLIDILTALGKDTLNRSVYYSYYGSSNSKNTCLCHLLSVSEPLPNETGATLKKLLKGKKISEKRLVEVAMYNPKWIDCIEEYLGWSGLKSGIYYFMAHMNERFSDRTQAIIAKYTPLSIEELNNGAFDLNWFLECSKQLGEEHFQVLYDSAKYISDSNKHTRARKYADAVLGKVTVEELEAVIEEKRNKDSLMSYALIPVKNEKDTLRRYQFLQKFLKESKQFGAQRRASEGIAVSMGLQNLATNSGYSDVTRLTLNMETKVTENKKAFFDWQTIEEIRIKIQIGEDGKPAIICEKNQKILKSIPTKYKNHAQVIELKNFCKQLKDQYSRTRAMMEEFMEDGVEFTVSEMVNLQKNPIIQPMLRTLVYLCGEQTGFLKGSIFTDYAGKETKLTPKKKLRIAHPFDLWKFGNWQNYQKVLFEKEIKQPFKQVFRELYVKTEEELERTDSLRYAGNQIQPQKTAACLKGRHWVADYEAGLQKIYYKENIVAHIYALADWFSPSDIEAPTLEWVEFSDRKTFQRIKIQDVPDRIFSEVMRDVDLAVSVAHAGGVDPETSHSTMEMRKTILAFNLPLFGLQNVTFTGNHALIQGKRASYTVHLGSGVVFRQGGAQIAVLPVHSQQRGKLFLPFIDEDPKTAEIMSKIVLFAEDEKIKDPYILNQL